MTQQYHKYQIHSTSYVPACHNSVITHELSYAIRNTDVPTSLGDHAVNRCDANVSRIDGLRLWYHTHVRH